MDQVAFFLELGRARLLQVLLYPLEPPLEDAEVGEDQLVLHRLRIPGGIDRARRMRNCLVVKGAHDVHERVGVLVAGHVDERLRTGPRGADDVGELDRRGHALPRVVHGSEAVEARVGDFGGADVDVAFAWGRLAGGGHELKEGCLAVAIQADERRTEHERSSLAWGLRASRMPDLWIRRDQSFQTSVTEPHLRMRRM